MKSPEAKFSQRFTIQKNKNKLMKTDSKTNEKLAINVGLLELYREATGDFTLSGDSWMPPDGFRPFWSGNSTAQNTLKIGGS